MSWNPSRLCCTTGRATRSHFLTCFLSFKLYTTSPSNLMTLTRSLLSRAEEEERDAVPDAVRKRWLGHGRKVGLKADVHLLAFVLDPFVQGALTTAQGPDCDLLAGEVLESARSALRHFSSDDHAKRSVLLQQFMLWNSAAPRLPSGAAGGSDDAKPIAQAMGNNAYSSLRLDAMQQSWNKVEVREAKLEADPAPRLEDSSGFAMREAIAKLRLTSSPVQFWLAMMNELPRGATTDQKEAHLLFCKTAADISSIVGHTCGVERAGKAYKQVLTSLRKAMEEKRAMKAVYVYSNYNLNEHKQSAGDSFSAFKVPDSAGEQAEVAAEQDPHARYTLRRGNEAISSSRMSPKMARTKTRATGRKPTVRMESRRGRG